jgi:Flp pilus assembly protein TadG
MRRFVKPLLASETGTTALEFALVAPVFLSLVIGTFTLCFGLLLIGSLHYAVEDAARCASVKTTICSDATSTIAYAQSRYFGPNVSPTFTYAAAACGNSVSASASYSMDVFYKTYTIPISATACFPLI